MEPSVNFFNLVKFSEGFRSKPYLDNKHGKVATIGYGTTKYPNGKAVSLTDAQITIEQANEYLKNDIKWAIAAIKKYVTVLLNQNQFDALLDFVYNVGEPNFKTSTLLIKINAKEQPIEIKKQFEKWVYDEGFKEPGLIIRRNNEVNLYFK